VTTPELVERSMRSNFQNVVHGLTVESRGSRSAMRKFTLPQVLPLLLGLSDLVSAFRVSLRLSSSIAVAAPLMAAAGLLCAVTDIALLISGT
jgi:hypothetical protein